MQVDHLEYDGGEREAGKGDRGVEASRGLWTHENAEPASDISEPGGSARSAAACALEESLAMIDLQHQDVTGTADASLDFLPFSLADPRRNREHARRSACSPSLGKTRRRNDADCSQMSSYCAAAVAALPEIPPHLEAQTRSVAHSASHAELHDDAIGGAVLGFSDAASEAQSMPASQSGSAKRGLEDVEAESEAASASARAAPSFLPLDHTQLQWSTGPEADSGKRAHRTRWEEQAARGHRGTLASLSTSASRRGPSRDRQARAGSQAGAGLVASEGGGRKLQHAAGWPTEELHPLPKPGLRVQLRLGEQGLDSDASRVGGSLQGPSHGAETQVTRRFRGHHHHHHHHHHYHHWHPTASQAEADSEGVSTREVERGHSASRQELEKVSGVRSAGLRGHSNSRVERQSVWRSNLQGVGADFTAGSRCRDVGVGCMDDFRERWFTTLARGRAVGWGARDSELDSRFRVMQPESRSADRSSRTTRSAGKARTRMGEALEGVTRANDVSRLRSRRATGNESTPGQLPAELRGSGVTVQLPATVTCLSEGGVRHARVVEPESGLLSEDGLEEGVYEVRWDGWDGRAGTRRRRRVTGPDCGTVHAPASMMVSCHRR
eukprot:2242772-Rhodomonas_salina.1